MRALGILLIVGGLVALIYGGFSYTKREKIVDVGVIEASVDREKRVTLPPILGAAALIAGVVLLSRKGRMA